MIYDFRRMTLGPNARQTATYFYDCCVHSPVVHLSAASAAKTA